MIIQVKSRRPGAVARYTYNAPPTIRVGDLVELPQSTGPDTWLGEVTTVGHVAAQELIESGYRGPIKAIVGRAPLKVTVEASTRGEMRQKLLDAIDDIDEQIERGNR